MADEYDHLTDEMQVSLIEAEVRGLEERHFRLTQFPWTFGGMPMPIPGQEFTEDEERERKAKHEQRRLDEIAATEEHLTRLKAKSMQLRGRPASAAYEPTPRPQAPPMPPGFAQASDPMVTVTSVPSNGG